VASPALTPNRLMRLNTEYVMPSNSTDLFCTLQYYEVGGIIDPHVVDRKSVLS
jgi:hypothetical protein